MIKKIIAYGDSFVQGGGLDPKDPLAIHKDSWPFQLGEKLNVSTVINRGVGGGSNKLSIFRLIEDADFFEDNENILIIFVWTGMERSCVYHEEENYWQNLLPTFNPLTSKHFKVSNFYYENMFSDLDSMLTIKQQKIFVTLYLNHLKVKYFFANSFIGCPHLHEKNNIDPFFRQDYLFGYSSSFSDVVCQQKNMISFDNYHPNRKGHEFIADSMLSFIKTKWGSNV